MKQQIIAMSLNASGIRDTARVLRMSTDTVLRALKKKEAALASVNSALLRTIDPAEIFVDIEQAEEAEADEMWSFVGKKGNPRWLWHAIDHHTGKVLVYVFCRRKDAVFLQLKALLEPFGLTRFYTYGSLGRICPASGYRRAQARHTEYPEDRAEASDLTDADQTVGPQDDLLLEIDTNARHRHWLIRQSLCLRGACLIWSSPHREHYPLFCVLDNTISINQGSITNECHAARSIIMCYVLQCCLNFWYSEAAVTRTDLP